MKIVFLNIWHRTRKAELTSFILQESPTTDIFCFQEADSADRESLRQILSEFTEYFHDKTDDTDPHIQFGQATFVKKTARVTHTYTLLEQAADSGLVLVTTIQHGNDMVTVANVHGISFVTDDKLDTTGRLVQSETIIDALCDTDYPVVIGGDFNMLPEAESIQVFTRAGYRDLVAEHQIETTRNRLAWERFPDNPQYYADYVFTSPGLCLQSFAVPRNEVSDHLPLIIELDPSGSPKQPHTVEAVTAKL